MLVHSDWNRQKIPKAARAIALFPPHHSAPFWWEAGRCIQRVKMRGTEEQRREMCDTFSVGRRLVRTGWESGADRGVRQRGEKGSRGHREELQLANGVTARLSATGRAPLLLRQAPPFNQPLRTEGQNRFCHPLSQRHQTGSCGREELGWVWLLSFFLFFSFSFLKSGMQGADSSTTVETTVKSNRSKDSRFKKGHFKYGGPKLPQLKKNY